MAWRLNSISRTIRTSFAKLILDKSSASKKVLDISKVQNILFIIHDDRIGDMIVSTMSFREIKKKYPDKKVLVLCGKNGSEILENNPHVDEVLEISGEFFKDIKIYRKLRKKGATLLIDFFEFDLRPLHLLSLRLIKPFFLIGFFKSKYNVFDLSIEGDFLSVHVTQRHKAVLKLLGIDKPDTAYDIFLTGKNISEAKDYLDKSSGLKIVLNPFASSKHRTMSPERVLSLVRLIKSRMPCTVYILCPPSQNISCQTDGVFVFKSLSILSAAALIKESDIVISPDTSIIHIASTFKKKTVGLYLDFSHRKEKTDIIWGPNNPNALIINVDTKGGLLSNDIRNISDEKILEKTEEIL